MRFREDPHKNEALKARHLSEVEALISRREDELAAARKARGADILQNTEAHRKAFLDMLGWPLNADLPRPTPKAEIIEELGDEGEYTVFRMRIEVLEGLWQTGLYYRLNSDERRPLVISQHGGAGTPELASGFYFDGSTVNYHGMVTGLLPHRVHVFMPALLLWDPAFYGAPYDRIRIDARLKRVGSSITALEVYGISRILDYFEAQNYVTTFGMAGLSYGGFYTLYTAAVDTRIRSAVSCSFFNARDAYPWTDWTWHRSAERFDDAEIAALVYPRRLAIEVGNRDDLFDHRGSEESFARLETLCAEVGTDWVSLTVFDGGHEFYQGNEHIEQMIRDLKS